jgi:phage terminase small subunit
VRQYDTFDTEGYSGAVTRRLRPPATLQGRARSVFVDLVTGCDPRHFCASDIPLLVRYCESAAVAEQAAAKLVEGVVIDDKPSPWFQIHRDACRTLSVLSLRLRLSPQARQPRTHKTTPGPVSAYEILDLEADHDGGAKSS